MPDLTLIPVHRAGVHVEELDGETVVYDRLGRQAIYLNESATVVWNLCDGQRTVAQMARLLAEEYSGPVQQFEADVSEAIDRMVKARVVTLAAPESGSADAAPGA